MPCSCSVSGRAASVHLCPYPEVNEGLIDEQLSADMDALLGLVSLGSAARNSVKIKVRQPLAELRVQPGAESVRRAVTRFGDVRVFLPGRLRDQETGLITGPITGCYALNGPMALAYVRARSIEIEDPNGPIKDEDGTRWRLLDQRADLDRIGRQQQFIRKLAGRGERSPGVSF